MPAQAYRHLVRTIRDHAIATELPEPDITPLLRTIGDARFVLIGEATHGTDDFYRFRAEITKQLILYFGFNAVAVEADWPDAMRVNKYVRGNTKIGNADSALAEFTRFPSWMWRNEAMVDFVDWLHGVNQSRVSENRHVGFYGLDLYGLNASIKAVLDYLDKVDPIAAKRARHYYGCFESTHAVNPQSYGYDATFGLARSCEAEVVQQLVLLRDRSFEYLKQDSARAADDFFYAEQNAKVIVDAEQYYRTMFQGRVPSWNLRDTHMADTLDELAAHLSDRQGKPAKVIVWAHNSHCGDARATEMGEQGEKNIGQLARERHGEDAFLIGFSTYCGSVTASSQWDGLAELKSLVPGIPDSYEALFHDSGVPNFMLVLRENEELGELLRLNRLQRAIGVLYLPETEMESHYFYARLPEQFDALIHLDETHAVQPLESTPLWHKDEVFETYPTGI